jgi:hypothetical protein
MEWLEQKGKEDMEAAHDFEKVEG